MMNTLRVDVAYRPLRIGWALRGDDLEACRRAVRLNHTLWGGRYNPLLPAEQPRLAQNLADAFSVDVVLPIGADAAVTALVESLAYLPDPFYGEGLFVGSPPSGGRSNVLDVLNLLSSVVQRREQVDLRRAGVRVYSWDPADPLSDVFLLQLGAFPSPTDIGIDYLKHLRSAARAKDVVVAPDGPVPPAILSRPSIASLGQFKLEPRHSTHQSAWSLPGFFLGSIDDSVDFISYWNLRAAGISLLFVDRNHLARYELLLPAWHKRVLSMAGERDDMTGGVGLWSRHADTVQEGHALSGLPVSPRLHSDELWNGLNIVPPSMCFNSVSTLGIVTRDREHPRVTFPLNDKPFCGDIWFHSQRLGASISFVGNPITEGDLYTFKVPSVPTLNEFLGRRMHGASHLRVEREATVCAIIHATDADAGLTAIPTSELFNRIFALAGYAAQVSQAGLLTRQIVSVLGGLQGARPFKVPGVRRLVKQYGPSETFTRRTALQLIGSTDLEKPSARFSAHERLFIEPRPFSTPLTPESVFSYLVSKGVFRIGRNVVCGHCRLSSWSPVDDLNHEMRCNFCGRTHNVTRQLVDDSWDYRRSGLLGAERNAQGAIPVVLTLQQLGANASSLDESVHSMSLELRPLEGGDSCEIDFAWMLMRPHRRRTALIIGECKDRGRVGEDEFRLDVENLRRVADAFPRDRLKVFILLSRLSGFSKEETAAAATLNEGHEPRVILLTDRELEPYHLYERAQIEFGLDRAYTTCPEDMAEVTSRIFFRTAGS